MNQSKSNFRVRIISSFLIILFPYIHIVGQDADGIACITKIKNELVTAEADTNRVFYLFDLCTAYRWWKSDEFEYYSIKGLFLPN